MLKPLEQWICDRCGEIIKKPEDGYVVWKTDDSMREHSFHIIHQSICDNDPSFHASLALTDFLGERGRQWLLSTLSVGVVKKNLGQSSSPLPVNMDEFVDFFRRVQTPYYEEARLKFNDRNVLEWFSDGNELTPYTKDALIRIINQDF